MAVRKVEGASVVSIVVSVSRDFLKLVLLGTLMAAPVSYYAMNAWLSALACNVGFQRVVFSYAATAGALAAFLTIGYHSLKICYHQCDSFAKRAISFCRFVKVNHRDHGQLKVK
ncbi:MAG: hypothetical protein AAGA64_14405 [Bacteroidota bacterium]